MPSEPSQTLKFEATPASLAEAPLGGNAIQTKNNTMCSTTTDATEISRTPRADVMNVRSRGAEMANW